MKSLLKTSGNILDYKWLKTNQKKYFPFSRMAKLKVYKSGKYEYLYIYWKYKKYLIRYNSEYKYKGVNYHTKDLLYNSKVENYKIKNEKIELLIIKINEYIYASFKNNEHISTKECKQYLSVGLNFDKYPFFQKNPELSMSLTSSIFILYTSFVKYKEKTVKQKASLKDYLTVQNTLQDYSKYLGKNVLNIKYMNTVEFLPSFHRYLLETKKHKDNTVHKRIQIVKSFMMYLSNNDIYDFKKSSLNFSVPKYRPSKYALSKEDIQFLLEHRKKLNQFNKRIIDCFIISCLTAIPNSDLHKINKRDIDFEKNPPIYSYYREKTNEKCNVPLSPTVLSIFQEYDYNFKSFVNQYFNRQLKNILKQTDRFKEEIKDVHYVNSKPVTNYISKYKQITSHTGRHTFITLAVSNNIPLNTIISITGHKSIQMLTTVYLQKGNDYSNVINII